MKVESRNPFGVMDAPDPDGADVIDFARKIDWGVTADDPNGRAWCDPVEPGSKESIVGDWFGRWNGGVDATISGDSKEAWKQGRARIVEAGDRVYVLFDWNNGARRALIDARRDGPRKLRGRYINLGDPSITRPWAGLIVDDRRIDGHWTNGRLDFRR